jgi:hypothetical protein
MTLVYSRIPVAPEAKHAAVVSATTSAARVLRGNGP